MARPREPPVFFVDRSLGSADLAGALRQAGVAVEVHDDHFPQNAPDEQWLDAVGKRGWVVLTKDGRIRRRPMELDALLGAHVAAFVLTAGRVGSAQVVSAFTAALPSMIRTVRTRTKPLIATVSGSGRVVIVRGGERRSGVKK